MNIIILLFIYFIKMTECINAKDNKFGETEKCWFSNYFLFKNFSISQELFSTKSTETPKL